MSRPLRSTTRARAKGKKFSPHVCSHHTSGHRTFLHFMGVSAAKRGGVCSCCNIPGYRFCTKEHKCYDCCSCL